MNKFIINQVQQHSSEMPDAIGSGKMEVVVMVISVLFVGLVSYLIFLDRRLRKLENK